MVTSRRAEPPVGHGKAPAHARLARRLLEALRRDLDGLRAAVASWRGVRCGLLTYQVYPGRWAAGVRRIHLRIEPDGSGLLLLDVTEAIHLNPPAALLARLALDHVPRGRAMRVLRGRLRGVDSARLGPEAEKIYALVEHISTTTDACPTCGLEGVARMPLFSTPARAPYKADLALSYGCNNACRHCYNPPERAAMPSLSLTDWRRVLTRLARIGVPQVIFTGGEPTLIDGLPGLIRHAGRLGMVAGLNTNGRRLSDRAFARALARAGLDHVQITLQSHRDEVHNAMTGADSFAQTVRGIQNSLAVGLHTITNTTLTRRNLDHAGPLVDFLHGLGLRTFAMNGMIYSGRGRTAEGLPSGGHRRCPSARWAGVVSTHTPHRRAGKTDDLAPVLVAVRDRAAELGMRFLWYTPTAYCRLSPVELELGPRRCNAGEYSICVEPNGDVLPCQSYYAPAGNILREPWERIWNSRLFRSFRDRAADPRGCGLPEPCWGCPDLSVCAGGCRIEREHNERMHAE